MLVDDAHALGVIGPGGRGTAHSFGLSDQVDLIGGTFSKSLASIGGWLVGERKVLDYIRHFAPSFMFAASAAPPSVAAAMCAFEVITKSHGVWRSCAKTSRTCATSSERWASSSATRKRP
jgi:7-keto-8-aminopelargonate synthetase-like enzyme